MTDTRTVWEQTGQTPRSALGAIIPCEAVRHHMKAIPAVDSWEHPEDCAIHLCVDCSVRLGPIYRSRGWKRISGWKQPA